MLVPNEIRSSELKLDSQLFPFALADVAFSKTIGIARSNRLDIRIQISGDFAEQKDDAILVDGCIDKTAKVDELANDIAMADMV